MTFTLDNMTAPSGGSFTGTFTVTNNTDKRISYDQNWRCAQWFGLYRRGTVVGGRRAKTCEAYPSSEFIEVGETLEFAGVIDTRTAGLQDAPFLEPGPYDAAVTFQGWSLLPLRVVIEPEFQS